VGVGKMVYTGVKQGVKYSPAIATVIREVRGPATDFAKARVEAARQRRLAVTKAASVRDGTVLQLLHGEQTVWVVYSGEEPVSEHPDVGVPLADLVVHADLARRRRPEEFPSPRQRAAAARKKTVSKVHLPRRHAKGEPDAAAPSDAPDDGPQDRPLSP
jgi:hypothetical protein